MRMLSISVWKMSYCERFLKSRNWSWNVSCIQILTKPQINTLKNLTELQTWKNHFELCLAGGPNRWTNGLALTDVVNDKTVARHGSSHKHKHETWLSSLDLFRHANNDMLPYDWKNGHLPCVKSTKLSAVPPAIPAP